MDYSFESVVWDLPGLTTLPLIGTTQIVVLRITCCGAGRAYKKYIVDHYDHDVIQLPHRSRS